MARWMPDNVNVRVLIGLESPKDQPGFGDHSKCNLDEMTLCDECAALWRDAVMATQEATA